MSLPPSYAEFQKALKRMKAWKAPGPDNIPLELIAHGGEVVETRLFMIILRMWETKTVPPDLKDATIITIFKKGDRSVCGNYRGISLLSIAGKIFARVLLDRLLTVAEEVLPESQCGFSPLVAQPT
ncbi:Hypp1700 [Branchiostoma lanceolatum]|uniref:Hypp1700 protein n=1 Tax=Branchiostoma lanceolatum TaxID=7740 RepID=A0A8K0EPU4_BRALA|nr:Hypp1700 [Branchiostoma lanceolatum]